MNKKVKLFTTIGIGALLLFIFYSFWMISRPKPLEIQGEVEATEIKVASKLSGRIDGLFVHKGDDVHKGQLLYTIKSPELEARLNQALAGLKGARAQDLKAIEGAQVEDIQTAFDNYLKAESANELAKKTFERINNLYMDSVMPAQKRDEAETQLKAAVETENAAKAQWEKAKHGTRTEDKDAAKAMVDHAEGVLDEVRSYLYETNIYSPIDGEISNIVAESGELVPAGYPIVTEVNLNDNWVTLNLREDLLASIHKGSVLLAVIPALGNKEIRLKISFISALGNFATWNATKTMGDFDMKTFEIHAVPVENISGLRPGMSALIDWRKVKLNH